MKTTPDEDEEGLAREIVIDATDANKSFYWNHEEGADAVKITRKVKRIDEVKWRKLDDEEKTRFFSAKDSGIDSFLNNEMLEICRRNKHSSS